MGKARLSLASRERRQFPHQYRNPVMTGKFAQLQDPIENRSTTVIDHGARLATLRANLDLEKEAQFEYAIARIDGGDRRDIFAIKNEIRANEHMHHSAKLQADSAEQAALRTEMGKQMKGLLTKLTKKTIHKPKKFKLMKFKHFDNYL
jgi:hypothetical protein